jgi:CheY-like chemotaxis protein
LAQVFANLLNNAAKYTDNGWQIRLTVRAEGNWVVISVQDNGIGIPPDQLPHVFELFTQVDRHATRAQGGLGIGLTLVKSLVEMHGGTVEARSRGQGQGSEFSVRLPLATVPAAASESAAPAATLSGFGARRVLVVDDNRDAAESLCMLLKLLGGDVRVAYDGAEALQTIDSHRPAVVFLDIGMPGMSGHEVARRIRQRPELDGVTLVALTGWGQDEDRRQSSRAGFDFHLTKPADLRALKAVFNSLENSGSSPKV